MVICTLMGISITKLEYKREKYLKKVMSHLYRFLDVSPITIEMLNCLDKQDKQKTFILSKDLATVCNKIRGGVKMTLY